MCNSLLVQLGVCVFRTLELIYILFHESTKLVHQVYYVYGFMALVFLIVSIVTVCVTIVGTYVMLNNENYKWQWNSFISGGATAGYVYLYAIYYFFSKTNMTGFLQTSFYFGYVYSPTPAPLSLSLSLLALCCMNRV